MLICLKKFSSLRSVDAALSRCSLAALVTAPPVSLGDRPFARYPAKLMSRQVAPVSSLAGSLATPLTVNPSLAALLVWGGAVTAMSPRYGGGAVLTATARALGQVRARYGTVERQG
jgi:hypothetical protein